MKKQARALTEKQWDLVFRARCKSKQGKALTDEERDLVDAAYQIDRKRYSAMEADVFDATVPFGSSARWRK